VNRALDLGINCFDTSEAYGLGASELWPAKGTRFAPQGSRITTKFDIGYKETPTYVIAAESCRRFDRKESVETEDRLRRRSQVRWQDLNTRFEETMSALDDLLKQGKVRAASVGIVGAWD
jgi:aryl-alcohol dehydrogenase-like predicted oxidoreductase